MSAARPTLTKKNENFIFKLNKHLLAHDEIDAEQKEAIVTEVTEQLLAGQKVGRTAVQLFESPEKAVQSYLNPQRWSKRLHDYSFAFLASDTSLVLLMFIAAFFTVTASLSKSNNGQNLGLLTALLLSIWGGVIYTVAMKRLIVDPTAPATAKKQQMPTWLLLLLVSLAWIVGFFGLLYLPTTINPVLPDYGNALVFGLALAAFFWNRKRVGYDLGGVLALSKLGQQARTDAKANEE
ncbi:DUF1129 family protein [Leuconostocaceae bacterium ESL0958]|nr:DUF1129 family protein [Leuconostocaceae bacterium ESL0958]